MYGTMKNCMKSTIYDQINFIRIQIQCRSKQATRCYVKTRPLIKLDKSNLFSL